MQSEDKGPGFGLGKNPLGFDSLITSGENFRRHDPPVKSNLIHRAKKGIVQVSGHRGTDPNLIVIDYGGPRGRATHVPLAFDRFPVQVTPNGFGVSEAVGNRDVIPALTHRKALIARPAMPVCGLIFGPFAAEKKIHSGLSAARPLQAEGPVLVVCGKTPVVRSTLGQNGGLITQFVQMNHGFHGNFVPVAKVEDRIIPWVGDDYASSVLHFYGGVDLPEGRVFGGGRTA